MDSILSKLHDPNIDMSRLAWNREEGSFWFHYTNRFAAVVIVDTEMYEVRGARKPPGLYVTDIQPGALEDEDLLSALFDGTREAERVQAAVVLADDSDLVLRRIGASAWVHEAAVGDTISLEGIAVGYAWQEDGLWQYSPSLWNY